MAVPLDTLTRPATAPGMLPGRLAALPPEVPLDMPVQDLRARPPRARRPDTAPRGMAWRRLFVFGAAILLTIFGTREMALVLDVTTPLTPGVVVLVLFVPLFAWIALSFVSSLCGAVSTALGGGRGLGIDPEAPLPALTGRTALLMPVYNEDPRRVLAGLEAMEAALREAGAADAFDIFILSDTTDPDAWAREEDAFLALRARAGERARIFYRRRAKNTDRKAGNIADWVRRFGGAYPQFLILDADSVMSAEALIRLAAAMEAHPGVGLIQSLPVIVNGRSLFARMQQFAGRLYGPVIAHGIAFWHGAEGNYWGHNAMIRTAAFAEAAGLPHLPGRKPFGGTIMSHDFVEAALMRRQGWAIHFIPALQGSYEESPPALSDLAIRDRRWCQGNLQHMAVLPTRGLHPVSRSHLLVGIGSYITAPLWLLFLLAGVLLALQARFVLPVYFPQGPALFPNWPVVDPVRAKWVFIGTMGLLLVPKLLAWGAMLLNGPWRRGHGGGLRALVSMVVETVLAGLLAPVTMLTQSVDVFSILRGRDSGWSAQTRDDGSLPMGQVARLYWRHTAFGLAFGVAAFLVSPYLAAWMSPVVVGLALAIPLAAWTAKRGAGQGLRRAGLLLIPEERDPPSILSRTLALRAEWEALAPEGEALARLRADPALLSAHRAMLPPPGPARPNALDASLVMGRARVAAAGSAEEALAALTRAEKAALLADPAGLDALLALPVR
ncbi:glucans biosynthesis glucosyltransferase MdoH [Roseomonas indoligenes]|uniref:Glucans biosynthesis glucosyltransferase H n=1 Tax=Roseomonas indoligenes TaxID=2820811 RepID=A0A940S7H4_9PROT|nr:glucans biosynthesis glucosyltransferase MdoH [Pararoseomonas indoligenes]